jgi:hypothetical protein
VQLDRVAKWARRSNELNRAHGDAIGISGFGASLSAYPRNL